MTQVIDKQPLEARTDVATCAQHPWAIAKFVLTPELQHWGKYVCPECNRWLCWVTKPDNEKRNRRNSKKLAKPFERAGIDYCQLCLRPREELPPNMVFVAHHVVEVRDGGTDEPSNLWHLCTFCHEMIHLIRRNRANPQCRPTGVAWEVDYETN